MKLIDLAPIHAPTVARLHIAGQPGTFLTSLGPDVLTVLYRALPQSSTGFGFVACEENAHLPAADAPRGFVAATTSTGRLFLELGTRHIHRFLPPLLGRFVQQPTLLPLALQTIAYPFLHGETGDNLSTPSEKTGDNPGDKRDNLAVAELLSIMVEPTYRGQGIGAQLLQRLIQTCRIQGITTLDVTVDAGNRGARQFYARHGFVERLTFQFVGRPMCSYRRVDTLGNRN